MPPADPAALLALLEHHVPSPEGRRALCRAMGLPEPAAAGAPALPTLPTQAEVGSATWQPPGGAESAEATGSEADLPTLAPLPSGLERYQDLGIIGLGGSSEVRQVHDRLLDRPVAMKLVLPERAGAAGVQARFLAEARATARLQHPGIVPVHEVGLFADGRPWFTMRQVEGRTLAEVAAEVHGGSAEWSLHRVVEVFRRVCETVAYAHSRGVVHRDLKPDNVMVGAFGEVLVLDWGVARASGPGGEASRSRRITGTPAYMAPEQAFGLDEHVGPRTDVYCLGALLYHLLCGRPPYDTPGAAETVRAVRAGPPPPPAGPDELVTICRRAMARQPAQRHADAAALAADVAAWLDGARRRQRALAAVARAEQAGPRARALLDQAALLDLQAAARLHGVELWDPVSRKVEAWRLEDQADALRREADLAGLEAEQALQGALTIDPELPEAHAALARRQRLALDRAELVRDVAAADRAARLLRQHATALPEAHPDRVEHLAWLDGKALLSLRTEPPGATVRLLRLEERDRQLVAVGERDLGRTPVERVPVRPGSYLCRVVLPGYATAMVPIELRRGQHEQGRPPGPAARVALPLVPGDQLGPDEVLVPPGPVWYGGSSSRRVGDEPPRLAWCHGTIFRRFPVTVGEYAAFLNDLIDAGRRDLALHWAPRSRPRVAGGRLEDQGPPYLYLDGAGRFGPGPDPDGDVLEARMPVFNVDLASACAYARWEAARTGLPWRLPGELEWIRAARGADRRRYPWGDHYDPALCNGRYGRGRVPFVAPVDAFETDQGPTGVRCLAGSVEEWTLDLYRVEGPPLTEGRAVVPSLPGPEALPAGEVEIATVGGSWAAHAAKAVIGLRGSRPARLRAAYLGFRLVRSWP